MAHTVSITVAAANSLRLCLVPEKPYSTERNNGVAYPKNLFDYFSLHENVLKSVLEGDLNIVKAVKSIKSWQAYKT